MKQDLFKSTKNENENLHDFSTLSSLVKSALDKLTTLPEEEKKRKNDDIKQMIEYYHNITDYVEDRRIKIAETAGQLVAVGVTASGLILALDIIAIYQIPILLIFASLILPAIITLWEYQVQCSIYYPFLDIPEFGNQWKWFYYGNPHLPQINNNPFKVSKTQKSDQEKYLQGLAYFVEEYLNEEINSEIKNNITQLYLLQVHNYYKNRFYLRLVGYAKLTTFFLLGFLIIFFLVIMGIYQKYPDTWRWLTTQSI